MLSHLSLGTHHSLPLACKSNQSCHWALPELVAAPMQHAPQLPFPKLAGTFSTSLSSARITAATTTTSLFSTTNSQSRVTIYLLHFTPGCFVAPSSFFCHSCVCESATVKQATEKRPLSTWRIEQGPNGGPQGRRSRDRALRRLQRLSFCGNILPIQLTQIFFLGTSRWFTTGKLWKCIEYKTGNMKM